MCSCRNHRFGGKTGQKCVNLVAQGGHWGLRVLLSSVHRSGLMLQQVAPALKDSCLWQLGSLLPVDVLRVLALRSGRFSSEASLSAFSRSLSRPLWVAAKGGGIRSLAQTRQLRRNGFWRDNHSASPHSPN